MSDYGRDAYFHIFFSDDEELEYDDGENYKRLQPYLDDLFQDSSEYEISAFNYPVEYDGEATFPPQSISDGRNPMTVAEDDETQILNLDNSDSNSSFNWPGINFSMESDEVLWGPLSTLPVSNPMGN